MDEKQDSLSTLTASSRSSFSTISADSPARQESCSTMSADEPLSPIVLGGQQAGTSGIGRQDDVSQRLPRCSQRIYPEIQAELRAPGELDERGFVHGAEREGERVCVCEDARRIRNAERYCLYCQGIDRATLSQERNERRASQIREVSESDRRLRLARLARHREHEAAQRDESRAARQAADSERHVRTNRALSSDLQLAGFSYSSHHNYRDHPLVAIGDMNVFCGHCNAKRFKGEAIGLCCCSGKVHLEPFAPPPNEYLMFYEGEHERSNRFLNRIREYNNCFAMTSFGVTFAPGEDYNARRARIEHSWSTFKIRGQPYHQIGNSVLSWPNDQPKYLQIYFSYPADVQADVRVERNQNLERNLVLTFQELLIGHNALIQYFQTALERMPSDGYALDFTDRRAAGIHRGPLNAPSVDDIVIVMVEGQRSHRDIIISRRPTYSEGFSSLQRIQEMDPRCDALQYPLIFWNGRYTYDLETIKQVDPITRCPTNLKVSAMNYYAYHLMIRRGGANFIHLCRSLLSQFVVDMYAKVEAEILGYIRLNQNKLRADDYIHLRDAIFNDGHADNIGRQVILPPTFTGSPRHMQEYAQDGMTYVRAFGRPDLFITFTCNGEWPEIVSNLMPGQQAPDRHDLVARVFRQKQLALVRILDKGELFGKLKAYMYSIEWQKRGLPYSHTLIWLEQRLRPDQIDKVICAELPSGDDDPELFAIISRHMVHGPCGLINRNSPCMQDGFCTKRYPRNFLNQTITSDDGYPLYRRRSPADGGHTCIKRVTITSAGSTDRREDFHFDNSWIVPYNRTLSKMFDSHLNVEYCNSVKSIKYICKYIYKGSGLIQVRPARIAGEQRAGENVENERDEINDYQLDRYISSNEAFWRLFSFPIHDKHPAIEHLVVHTRYSQQAFFNPNNATARATAPPRTTLTAFFSLCESDEFARNLLYPEVPKYYVWNKSSKVWTKRQRGIEVPGWDGKASDTIGRVYTVSPRQSEEFHLRLLLHHVRGPTSFENIRTFNGHLCTTLKQACLLRGLLENDAHWEIALRDAAALKVAGSMRILFAIMLNRCMPAQPKRLWDLFKNDMSDDIRMQRRRALRGDQVVDDDQIFNQSLILLEDICLRIENNLLCDLGMYSPNRQADDTTDQDIAREMNYDRDAMAAFVEENRQRLVADQLTAYEAIGKAVRDNRSPKVIFLDAPGGTGKTFLMNLVLARIRQDGEIAIAVATSGIAATLLSGGRTAHSAFKLPLTFHSDAPTCNIWRGSSKAHLLQRCKLIVWDECTMANRKCFEALDRTLQYLRDNERPFGGVVVVLAGDFRQTLPIVRRGTPADEINACLKKSYIWNFVKTFKLRTNMRVAARGRDAAANNFAASLLRVGDGTVPFIDPILCSITLPTHFCRLVRDEDHLIQCVFPNLLQNYRDAKWLCERAILATTNDAIGTLNRKIQDFIVSEVERTYRSIDTAPEEQQIHYPAEFLNSLSPSGFPTHILYLKVGSPIMLLRTLDPPKLVNGTKLCVTGLTQNLIHAKIMIGPHRGEQVFIPRIPLVTSDQDSIVQFKRLQFPVRLAYAMTINNSQGQSLQEAGLHLEKPVFSHGQLYKACSRVGSPSSLYVFAPNGATKNVVYKQALR